MNDQGQRHVLSPMSAPVSVIIPCYRCRGTIERALRSVLWQSVPPEEVLMIEDGSGDGGRTLSLLHHLKQRHQGKVEIKVLALRENRGAAAARNTGWEAARLPFVAFLDADDAWHPRKIEIQYRWMKHHPEAALSGHPRLFVREDEGMCALPDQWSARPVSAKRLLFRNWFFTSCVMLRRDTPFRFDPAKRYSEDYLLWLKILLSGYRGRRLELPLGFCFKPDFGSSGLSGDLWRMEKGELDTYGRLYREGLIPPLLLPLLYFLSLAKYLRRVAIASLRV